jgi:hypothetical protein
MAFPTGERNARRSGDRLVRHRGGDRSFADGNKPKNTIQSDDRIRQASVAEEE